MARRNNNNDNYTRSFYRRYTTGVDTALTFSSNVITDTSIVYTGEGILAQIGEDYTVDTVFQGTSVGLFRRH